MVDVWIKISDFTTSSDTNLSNKVTESSIDIAKTIKTEPEDTDSLSNFDDPIGRCSERVKEEPREPDDYTSHIYLEHDYANMPISTTNTLENENNVTISHSPNRNNGRDNEDDSSIGLSSINGEATRSPQKNGVISTIYEEVVVTSENTVGQSETQQRAVSNGNCFGSREFPKVSKIGEHERTVETCKTTKFDGIDSSNIQASVDVATMVSGLENSSPMLKPLRIAIPAAFESLRRTSKNSQPSKHILVLKDNKLIPINSTRLVLSGATTTKAAKPVMQISRGVSLLKKPPNLPPTNCPEKLSNVGGKILFKLNSTNSLILNSSDDIPALKIAEPVTRSNNGAQRVYLVEKKPPQRATVGITAEGKNKSQETTTADHWLDNLKIVTKKPKITLGKDRVGAASKKESYEEILR